MEGLAVRGTQFSLIGENGRKSLDFNQLRCEIAVRSTHPGKIGGQEMRMRRLASHRIAVRYSFPRGREVLGVGEQVVKEGRTLVRHLVEEGSRDKNGCF
jgi:hypothetical protein